YVIKIRGVEVAKGEVMADRYMAMDPGDAEGELEGIDAIEPAFGLPTKWIDETQRERAEMLGYTIVDPPSVIATHITEVIRRHAHEFMGRQEVKTLIENVKQTNPAVVEELIPKLLSFGEVQKILANLLKEGVSIRDMLTILETLADYAPVTTDTDILTEYVRQALGRAISKKYMTDDNQAVLTLDPALEQLIMESVKKTETGSYLAMDPKVASSVIDNLSKHIEKLLGMGSQPVVLASPIVRLYFKRMTQNALPDLAVLSYNELEPNLEVKPAGVISA
ncbi:MAG: FHIPEP family type III secretion protein, partial [Lentisphaerae bacterium]|nr:FHIPEP family type III secretion protein [Lentisphaerota bacterium]